ncbi:MAG: hypothetical protein H0X33_06985 [Taibaiella sp.]|nr:hypothetical protein [Taibaiella sp.]
MNYATTQINAARHIARAAEKQIKTTTGMRIKVMLCTTEDRKGPQQMLQTIANALGMCADCFTEKTRKREVVELRFLSSLLLRKFYPRVTLMQIAAMYGGQDHTSIINGVTRASNLLDTNEPTFTGKYYKALNTVTKWLKD